MNDNNKLIFKANPSTDAPAQYATSFAELNFNQDQFKFNSTLPVDTNRAQFKKLDRKTTPAPGIYGIENELDNEEQKFQSQCEFLQEKIKSVREKISEFYETSNIDEVSKQFQEIIYEETKKDLDKQQERLKNILQDISWFKKSVDKISSFKDEVEKIVQKVTQQFDSNFLALSSSKEQIRKMESSITRLDGEFKSIERFSQNLEKTVSETFKKILSSFEPEILREQCNVISSTFTAGMNDFFEYKSEVNLLLKQFREDYLTQKCVFEAEENEYRLLKKKAAELKEEKLSDRAFIEQTDQKIETVFQTYENEEFECLLEIKNLEGEIQKKKDSTLQQESRLEAITKELEDLQKQKQKLDEKSTKISNELINVDKDMQKLNSSLKALEKEELKLNEKATQMKIELAVQSTLKQEHSETKQLLSNKIAELKNMNTKLKQTIVEKRSRNEEKKNNPFNERPKQRMELANLEEELKETTKLHSEVFKDELPDFTQDFINFFGNDFEIFDPSFNQVMHSLKIQVSQTEIFNNNTGAK